MKRTIILSAMLIISVMVSGCQLLPGKSGKTLGPKKSIFGIHGKKDSDFERKVANDPFPTADSVSIEYK